eukprot:SAG22_NODE_6302_length_872_cov_2.134541_1_plen_275_part_10
MSANDSTAHCYTQVPAGAFAQAHGGKLALAINTLGTALTTLLLPFAARVGGSSSAVAPRLMTILLAIMGLFQGSLVPGQVQMQRDWLPTGSARAWVLSCTEMANACIILGCQFATPRLARRFGWQAVPLAFGSYIGVFGLLWVALATNKPGDGMACNAAAVREKMMPPSPPPPPRPGEKRRKTQRPNLAVFATPPAQAVILSQIASNNSNYTLQLWAPIYFTEKLVWRPASLSVGNADAAEPVDPRTILLLSRAAGLHDGRGGRIPCHDGSDQHV